MTRIDKNQVCYRNLELGHAEPWSLEVYRSIGGYSSWESILAGKMDPDQLVEAVKTSALRGRGGAGFPTGLKWGFMNRDLPGSKYVVINSDEGEPGTCKDNDILRLNPHQLIEGAAIMAHAIGAEVAYNYLRGEFGEQYERMEAAVAEAIQAGLLGDNIRKSGVRFHFHNVLGAGAYIVGEETAMLESLEGKKGQPRYKPPFPANYGLYGRPTTINNTETIASVPVILEKGADWFLSLGKPNNGGTKIFCVSGHIQKPGNFEVGLGLPFKDLLALAGGVLPGRELKAVIPGGSSMKVLPADVMMNIDMDYDSLMKAGSGLGSGGVIVMDDSTCMVRALANVSHFYKMESCGQCTPCREGVAWVSKMVDNILTGKAQMGDIERLANVAHNIEGRTICAFGEAAAWPVGSFIQHFHHEFEYFIREGRSMVTGELAA